MSPSSLSALFTPVTIGAFDLSHRVVMSTPPRRRARAHGIPTPLMALHHGQRASAGGLVIAEATAVSQEGGADPGMPGLYTSEQTNLWRTVTDAVHERGGIILAQLAHDASPSGNADLAYNVDTLIERFRDAAENASDAGFDGVELHAAPGSWADRLLHGPHDSAEVAGAVSDVLQALCSVWSCERVGLSLEWKRGSSVSLLCQEMHRLDVGYLRLVGSPPDRPAELRAHYRGALMAAATDPMAAAAAVAELGIDAMTFELAFVANPDLPERLRASAPLATADLQTLGHGNARGYTDYPALNAAG